MHHDPIPSMISTNCRPIQVLYEWDMDKNKEKQA